MKNYYLILSFFLVFMFVNVQTSYAQYGSTKYCPNTPAWNANKNLMANKKEMFNEYALGPDGCWWLKLAKHSSYVEGFYQFSLNGTKYYYNKKKNFWENANRSVCVNPPFGK